MALEYAIIFMDKIEREFLNTQHKKPLVWWRFIDDIFIIWPHLSEELKSFITALNDYHHTIKFTFTINKRSVNFLDIIVNLDDKGNLTTTLYKTPMDANLYLHYSSHHPKHQKDKEDNIAKTKTTQRKVECFGESGGKNLKTRIQCLKCDKKFASIRTLRRHHKTFHEPTFTIFECLHCPATFTRKHGVKKHIINKHQEKPTTDFNEKTATPKAAADPIAKWVSPVEAQTKHEMTPKLRIVAASPKYTAPTPIKIQETPEMPSMDVLKEDLQLSDSEDSDDDVIYVKTTGPPKYSTNSYGYLVEEVPTYQTTNCYKTYKGPVQSSSQQTVCTDELTENNWMSQVTV
ncbi:unnamed protein product [Mytilus coruscus]|uniref:C2H2-type domain-containing protein n=1 Tax=Mytilus coruscus TaxID=42192 RepID=A0A6J8ARA8_MYTCO|nr:unnamed protein product [Mytilus coruscus]